MALNTFKCNYLTPLHFKGLICITNSAKYQYVKQQMVTYNNYY